MHQILQIKILFTNTSQEQAISYVCVCLFICLFIIVVIFLDSVKQVGLTSQSQPARTGQRIDFDWSASRLTRK